MNRSILNSLFPVKASQSGSPAVGVIIDTQGYDSLMWVLILTSAGATTFTVTESDASDMSGETAVDAFNLETDTYGAGSTVHKISYVGGKRYVRLTHTGAGTCVALLGNASQEPV